MFPDTPSNSNINGTPFGIDANQRGESSRLLSTNTPLASAIPRKSIGGGFSFLKAVAMLRKNKVAPVKKMTKEEIHKLFRKSFISVLAVIRLNKVCEDIRNFGTSPSLFDVATRNRPAVKKVLFPLSYSDITQKKTIHHDLEFPLISPENSALQIWNSILVILIVYSATVLPYRIAFQDDISLGWEVFDYGIDGLYWFDLVINMFSSYYDDDNQIVTKRSVVIKKYLKTWFLIDLFCSLPIDLIMSAFVSSDDLNETTDQTTNPTNRFLASNLKLLKLAKLPRLYRLLKVTKVIKMFKYFGSENKFLQSVQINSGIVRLVNLFFFVFAVVHFIGCLWLYQAKLQDFDEQTWVYRAGIVENSNASQYLYSIYYVFTTITTVGYGDISAYTTTEISITLVLMVIGVGFYSSTIGILSSVIQYMDSKQILLQRKVEIMNEYCNEMKIPNSVKNQLKEALQYTLEKNCFMWANQSKVFDSLPMNLKFEICMNVHKGIMKTFSLFNLADDQSFIVRIVPQLRPLKLQPGDLIWNEKDVAESIYLLSNGRVNYLKQVVEDIKTKEKKSIMFKTMINGSYFGEIDIIFDRKRKYRCQAETQCELYYITRQEYETIIRKEFPHIHQKLKKTAFERDKKNEEALTALKKLIRHAKNVAEQHGSTPNTQSNSPTKLRRKTTIGAKENAQKIPEVEVIDHNIPPIEKFRRAVRKIQYQRLYETTPKDPFNFFFGTAPQNATSSAQKISNSTSSPTKQVASGVSSSDQNKVEKHVIEINSYLSQVESSSQSESDSESANSDSQSSSSSSSQSSSQSYSSSSLEENENSDQESEEKEEQIGKSAPESSNYLEVEGEEQDHEEEEEREGNPEFRNKKTPKETEEKQSKFGKPSKPYLRLNENSSTQKSSAIVSDSTSVNKIKEDLLQSGKRMQEIGENFKGLSGILQTSLETLQKANNNQD